MAKKIKIKAAAVVTENNTPLSVLNTVVSSAEGFIDHDTTYTAKSPISISSSNEISIDESKLSSGGETVSYTAGTGINIQNDIISLSDTVLSAETTVGPTGDQETSANGSINVTVPQITVDKTGRVTSLTSRNIKITDTNTVTDPGNPSVYTADTPIQISADNKISLTTVPESLGGTGETSLSSVTVGGANNAASVGGHTVGVNVPSNAVFTDSHYTAVPSSEALSTNNVGIRITENNQVSGTVTLTGGGGTTVSRDSSGKILITSTATETGTDNDTHYQAIPTIISGTTNQTAAIGIKENNTLSGSVTLKAGANVSINGSGTVVTITAANTDTNTTYTGSGAVSLSGTTFDLASIKSAATNGPTADVKSNIFTVPYVATDKYGRVTLTANRSVTVPAATMSGGADGVISLSGGGTGSITFTGADNITIGGGSNKVTIGASQVGGNVYQTVASGTSFDTFIPDDHAYTKYVYIKSPFTAAQNGPMTYTTSGWPLFVKTERISSYSRVYRQTAWFESSSETSADGWTTTGRTTYQRFLYSTAAGVVTAGDWSAMGVAVRSAAPTVGLLPGRLWLDTDNNVLSIYTGSSWVNVSNP